MYDATEIQTPPWLLQSQVLCKYGNPKQSKQLQVKHSLQTKAVIELLHAQNDITFVIVAPLILSVNWQEWQFWLAVVLRSSKTIPFEQQITRSRFRYYFACTVHMETCFTALCWWWLRSRCLLNPSQSNIWWITTTRRNFYQPVLSVSTVTVPLWRCGFLFMTCRTWTLLSDCSVQIVESLQLLYTDLHDYCGAL